MEGILCLCPPPDNSYKTGTQGRFTLGHAGGSAYKGIVEIKYYYQGLKIDQMTVSLHVQT